MRLTQLRSFHAVARAGGFTGAAKLLHISQPTVTTQVKTLEEAYGVELFHRQGRKVKLTPFGAQLFRLAQHIFTLETETVNLLKNAAELKYGHLRIGAVGPFHVTEMLARFNRHFPQVQLSMRLGNSAEVLQGLLDYQTDVAVLAQFNDDGRFHSVPYSRHEIVVFVHRSHRFALRRSIRIAELQDEGMILRERGSTTRMALDDALRHAGVRVHVLMEIGSREAIREAVIKGVGIGAVSEAEYIPDPELAMVRLSDVRVHTHAHVLCLEERRGMRMISAFFDIVEQLRAQRATAQ